MFKDNKNLYPTPVSLIHKMIQDIDFRAIRSILEPSAGSGNIAKIVTQRMKSTQYNSYSREEKKFDIDCIELDQNLRYILQGKGFRVVCDDFLIYDSYKKYDLIIMNPPFDNGDKHLLKALEIQQQGGQIVCILNAETLKNPYSNIRKDLIKKLTDLNASIEYLQQEFVESERSTDVEIALIKINIENKNKDSIILNNLRQEEKQQKAQENTYKNNNIISSEFIEAIVSQYNFEVKAGLKLINENESLKPFILKSFKKDSCNKDSILKLTLNDYNYEKYNSSSDTLINAYIKKVRYKYWETLFNNENFTSLLTSNLLNEYRQKITDLQEYDFSYYNIKEIQIQMNKGMIKGVEDTILALFDEFSYKYSWDKDSSNIHYFNGWKTNKSWKIGSKIIIPLSAYNWCGSLDLTGKPYDKIKDIEKVFDYLDGNLTENMDLKEIFQNAENTRQTSSIITKYCKITFYKKGTCHIIFTNEELLKKFNLFGCQKHGWLPPSYAKAKYNDMTKEEQSVIDEFEGKESYSKVINNTEYYIYNPEKMLLLNA
jgi:hypothetical protein